MTTLNPLGKKPFWVSVLDTSSPHRRNYVSWMTRRGSLKNSIDLGSRPIYYIKVTPWIPHDGGPCPVGENVVVKIRYRSGKITRPVMVGAFPDMLDGLWKEIGNSPDDIVAYQIVE